MSQTTYPLSSSWVKQEIFTDILYHKYNGIAKITINRPEVRNAFRPLTIKEMQIAFEDARLDPTIGVVILTGHGKDAFCSGGDQNIRTEHGYTDEDGIGGLHVLDLQKQIRSFPKVTIAMVAGYAIGGGHVLHLICDLTIASDHSIFGQTGPKVGSFDGGFGSGYLARVVGQKKAREIWFLCKQYTASEALSMGLVNHICPYDKLEATTISWSQKILEHSPLAIRCLKSSFNAELDGQSGIQELAGNATLLYYMTAEAQVGKNAFLNKEAADYSQYPWRA